MKSSTTFSDFNWKISEYKLLNKYGIHRSLLKDFLSKNYRNESFRLWNSLGHLVAKKEGFLFHEDTEDGLLREVFINKIYEVRGFIPEKNDSVVDIGAAYGETAIYWAKKFEAKVWAFEPNPVSFSIMLKNIALNNVQDKIFPFNVAIGDGSSIKFNESGGLYTSSTLGEELKTSCLNYFNIERMDILKIDVEGFECEVLKGSLDLISRYYPKIIIETHSKYLRKRCLKILGKLNYKLIYRDKSRKGTLNWMDEVRNNFLSID